MKVPVFYEAYTARLTTRYRTVVTILKTNDRSLWRRQVTGTVLNVTHPYTHTHTPTHTSIKRTHKVIHATHAHKKLQHGFVERNMAAFSD